MRVITGTARGTKLKTPEGMLTRPTTDRVKEALFNIIQFDIAGDVLDLFAGTGQLGIEALSRGASRAVFVDHRQDAAALVRENLRRTHFEDRGEVVRGFHTISCAVQAEIPPDLPRPALCRKIPRNGDSAPIGN